MPDNAARARAVKAVIPAAGLATRFLPATKAVPKELLPVVDRPVLQYIVEEAAAAGIRDVLLVTGRGKTSMVDHFDRSPTWSPGWRRRATSSGWPRCGAPASWPRSTPAGRASRSGLGHAVSYAESHVGGESFAVLLGDEFVDRTSRCCRRCSTCRPGPAASCSRSSRSTRPRRRATASPRCRAGARLRPRSGRPGLGDVSG